MKRMEEMILKEGKILPGGVLKVGSLLNQQVDIHFMKEIGDEVARLYKDAGATSTPVKSFTHGNTNNVVVTKEYLSADDKVLIVDDFLAHGSALTGLIDIVGQAGATVVGCVAAIEKGFQLGGDRLREQGYRIESLAIVDEMTDDGITFREQ